ncbi:hypothetical protein FQN60_017634 [Etheostoma spectabile]|uniref:Uncharacterized protein n=1 Tax=Etheostoma spectabile TaxID=54343 RepID=A0A5J5DFY5_9PERO|nr:hypothetical protein FQN60_017634 [Etheostoma spectabile]
MEDKIILLGDFRQGFFQAGIEGFFLFHVEVQGRGVSTHYCRCLVVDQHETDGHEAFADPHRKQPKMIPSKVPRYKATSPPPYLPLFTNEDEHNKSHKNCGRSTSLRRALTFGWFMLPVWELLTYVYSVGREAKSYSQSGNSIHEAGRNPGHFSPVDARLRNFQRNISSSNLGVPFSSNFEESSVAKL